MVDEQAQLFSLQTSMNELTESDAREMLEAFKLFDRDGDSRISKTELGSVLRALGQNPTEASVREILKETDANKNGFLEFDEYKNLVKSHVISQEEIQKKLLNAFKVFDKDNNGALSVRELTRILTMTGEKMTREEVREVFRDLDVNCDGKLVYSGKFKYNLAEYHLVFI
ncbi:neo-calmodulin-like [Liolophura sinensis]|uniref:neo-calmodulin-like n=1 Tax=Liolophura sinensis TaxID=3198878 RepID=UPI0031597E14